MFGNTTTANSSGKKAPAIALLLIALASTITVGYQAISAQEPAADESFFMFNTLWFKEDGGAAKYTEYQAISYLREEAIRDSLLICFRKL